MREKRRREKGRGKGEGRVRLGGEKEGSCHFFSLKVTFRWRGGGFSRRQTDGGESRGRGMVRGRMDVEGLGYQEGKVRGGRRREGKEGDGEEGVVGREIKMGMQEEEGGERGNKEWEAGEGGGRGRDTDPSTGANASYSDLPAQVWYGHAHRTSPTLPGRREHFTFCFDLKA